MSKDRGTPDVPDLPPIPVAGKGTPGGAPPAAWDRGSERSPYGPSAPPQPAAPAQYGVTPPTTGVPGAPFGAAPAGGQPGSNPLVGYAHSPAAGGPANALPQMQQPPLDGVALSSVIAGALGTGPIALVLGILGLRRVTNSWRRSPRIAWTGIGLGALGTVGWVVFGVVAAMGGFGSDGSSQAGDSASVRVVHASYLAPGNCVEFLPPQQDVSQVTVVPCAQEHVAQVVALAPYEETEYPGGQPSLDLAEERCGPIVADYLTDELRAWWIAPSPASWDEGATDAICLVRTSGVTMTEDVVN